MCLYTIRARLNHQNHWGVSELLVHSPFRMRETTCCDRTSHQGIDRVKCRCTSSESISISLKMIDASEPSKISPDLIPRKHQGGTRGGWPASVSVSPRAPAMRDGVPLQYQQAPILTYRRSKRAELLCHPSIRRWAGCLESAQKTSCPLSRLPER